MWMVNREMIISAHHNRIEQLRESFKKKMEEADAWPEKVQNYPNCMQNLTSEQNQIEN